MGGKRRMGEGRKKAKESWVVPHTKLNPGCATATAGTSPHGKLTSKRNKRKLRTKRIRKRIKVTFNYFYSELTIVLSDKMRILCKDQLLHNHSLISCL